MEGVALLNKELVHIVDKVTKPLSYTRIRIYVDCWMAYFEYTCINEWKVGCVP